MLVSIWLALGAFATIMTLLWALVPRKRVYVTSIFAFGAWALLAYYAPALEALDGAGGTLAVPPGDAIQLFLGGLAALSGIVFLASYWWGLYPPTDDDTTTHS